MAGTKDSAQLEKLTINGLSQRDICKKLSINESTLGND